MRWATVEAARVAVGSDPYWQVQFQRLEKRMPRNQAIVAIATSRRKPLPTRC